jgi:Sulfotransferase family
MSEPFIVSVHIPKTAGTSLALVLDRCFHRRIMYDYQDYSEPQIASAEVSKNASFIQNYFHALHGHFFASKYFDVFPNASFIATLRHPVSRVISQFFHELNDSSSRAWYHHDIASGRMDIADFAQQDGIGDAMARHLAGRELRDYSALLISEYLLQSCHLLSQTVRPLALEAHFGSPVRLPILNQAVDRAATFEINQKTREAIYARTKRDNEVYSTAVGLLKHRIVHGSL